MRTGRDLDPGPDARPRHSWQRVEATEPELVSRAQNHRASM
jgi:hypothetical protein